MKTLIVDDEALARENLKMMIDEFCPELSVVDMADGVDSARIAIEQHNPDVVFLDIRMPSGAEGFDLLDSVADRKFMVVFVTAFKEYAVKAFNANAVHYILKPIDVDDLRNAVQKLIESKKNFDVHPDSFGEYVHLLKDLGNSISNNQFSNKITISHTKGMKIIEDDSVVHLDADGNCTSLYFKDGSRYLDTRTLKVYEEMLNPAKFYRVHKSHIINLNHLKEYLSEDGHFAVMDNGAQLPVARNRLSSFLSLLKSM
mgnify:FL=1